MKNFIKAFLWFLVLALLALFLHYFYGEKTCGVCDANKPKVEVEPVGPIKNAVVQLAEFTIKASDGSTAFKFPEGFVVNANNGTVAIPQGMQGFKDSIYNFLNKNQNKELLITAKYLKSEGKAIGMDRAKFLKEVLVKAQINPDRIVPKAVLSDYSYAKDAKYGEGIAMVFQNVSADHAKAVEASITSKTLYAHFGSADFKADRTLKAYAFELNNYLKMNPTKNVTITGHTDNKGSSSGNYNLGLKRAKQVMIYLISQGIDKPRISSKSQGENVPVASNDTEEGRAKNRRISIAVK